MYIPPRRERGEKLILKTPDGGQVLAEYSQTPSWLPTQRRFLASPDGSQIAFLRKGMIVVRDRRGSEVEISEVAAADFRFRADGSEIATARRSSNGAEIVLVTVATGGSRPLARVGNVTWLECSREGVVVAELVNGKDDEVTLATWAGVAHKLAKAPSISRVLAGQASRRAAFVVDRDVYAVDVSMPGGRPKRIGRARDAIVNAEMSPDGSKIALVTGRSVEFIDKERPPKILSTEPGVHTVWFSADGSELAWASAQRVTLVSSKKRYQLDGKNVVRGARFHRFERGLVVARGQEALHWKPGSSPTVLADAGGELIGAEATHAGIVLFSRDALRPAV
jgi:hypothetical protein